MIHGGKNCQDRSISMADIGIPATTAKMDSDRGLCLVQRLDHVH
jgi:hypothetical protein